MQPEQLRAIDGWIDAQFTDFSRPDAVRTLVDLGLDYRAPASPKRKKR